MKFELIMVLTILSSLTTLTARADWSARVISAELIYGCGGKIPNLAVVHAANITTQYSQIRLPDAAFVTSNSKISMFDPRAHSMIEVGFLVSAPICEIENGSEPPHAFWNAVQFIPGTSLNLTFSSNPSTCSWDQKTTALVAKNITFCRQNLTAFL